MCNCKIHNHSHTQFFVTVCVGDYANNNKLTSCNLRSHYFSSISKVLRCAGRKLHNQWPVLCNNNNNKMNNTESYSKFILCILYMYVYSQHRARGNGCQNHHTSPPVSQYEIINWSWEIGFKPGHVVKSLSRAFKEFTKQFEMIMGV